MSGISGVLLVHNEERYLPYCLNSLRNAGLDELIVILDRCTDNSEAIIGNFHPKYPVKVCKKTWNKSANPIAETANYGFSLASHEIIYILVADVSHDPSIFDSEWFNEFDMVNFKVHNSDLDTPRILLLYERLLRNIYHTIIRKEPWEGGIFGVKKAVWQKFQFHNTISQFGEHTQFLDFKNRIEKARLKYFYVKTARNLHLRENVRTKTSQLQQGRGRAMLRYPFWRVFIHALIHFKPYVVAGYLQKLEAKAVIIHPAPEFLEWVMDQTYWNE